MVYFIYSVVDFMSLVWRWTRIAHTHTHRCLYRSSRSYLLVVPIKFSVSCFIWFPISIPKWMSFLCNGNIARMKQLQSKFWLPCNSDITLQSVLILSKSSLKSQLTAWTCTLNWNKVWRSVCNLQSCVMFNIIIIIIVDTVHLNELKLEHPEVNKTEVNKMIQQSCHLHGKTTLR